MSGVRGFRFAAAVVALTAVAVGRGELERRTLQARRERTVLADERVTLEDRRAKLTVRLAELSADAVRDGVN